MALEPEIPYVDFASIDFPSDRLTVGTIKCMYPELFDPKGPPALPPDELWSAYIESCQERGIPVPPRKKPVDTFLELLRSAPDDCTIRDLRRQHWEQFDLEEGDDFDTVYDGTRHVLGMLFNERVLARMAYQEALGQPYDLLPGDIPEDREGYTGNVVEAYIDFGIAGKEEAKQLIRKFTGQAMSQARPPDSRQQPPRR
jgi:hypothetical protein